MLVRIPVLRFDQRFEHAAPSAAASSSAEGGHSCGGGGTAAGAEQQQLPEQIEQLYGEHPHASAHKLCVSPLATVLQGGTNSDSVQRLIYIAQNLSLQSPTGVLGSAASLRRSQSVPLTRTTKMASPSSPVSPVPDWPAKERGFIHRQILHKLLCRTASSSQPASPGHQQAIQ